MPFRSESQRRFLWAKHPEIARRWAEKEKQMDPMDRAEKLRNRVDVRYRRPKPRRMRRTDVRMPRRERRTDARQLRRVDRPY